MARSIKYDAIKVILWLFSGCPSTVSGKSIVEWRGRCVYMSGSNEKVITTAKTLTCTNLFGSTATGLMLQTREDYDAFVAYR